MNCLLSGRQIFLVSSARSCYRPTTNGSGLHPDELNKGVITEIIHDLGHGAPLALITFHHPSDSSPKRTLRCSRGMYLGSLFYVERRLI
ncbi:hypothetical protein LguiA_029938 [Lonicera macranthoides]